MGMGLLPHKVVVPIQLQAAHIGVEGGLHAKSVSKQKAKKMEKNQELEPFHGKISEEPFEFMAALKEHKKGYGGWGHPADQEHCLKLFGEKDRKTWRQALGIA
jgi:hypothetical protein